MSTRKNCRLNKVARLTLPASQLKAVHGRKSALGRLDVNVPDKQMWGQSVPRSDTKGEGYHLLDKAETLALARDGIPVKVNELELSKRLKDLLHVVRGEIEVEVADVEPVVGDLGIEVAVPVAGAVSYGGRDSSSSVNGDGRKSRMTRASVRGLGKQDR